MKKEIEFAISTNNEFNGFKNQTHIVDLLHDQNIESVNSFIENIRFFKIKAFEQYSVVVENNIVILKNDQDVECCLAHSIKMNKTNFNFLPNNIIIQNLISRFIVDFKSIYWDLNKTYILYNFKNAILKNNVNNVHISQLKDKTIYLRLLDKLRTNTRIHYKSSNSLNRLILDNLGARDINGLHSLPYDKVKDFIGMEVDLIDDQFIFSISIPLEVSFSRDASKKYYKSNENSSKTHIEDFINQYKWLFHPSVEKKLNNGNVMDRKFNLDNYMNFFIKLNNYLIEKPQYIGFSLDTKKSKYSLDKNNYIDVEYFKAKIHVDFLVDTFYIMNFRSEYVADKAKEFLLGNLNRTAGTLNF